MIRIAICDDEADALEQTYASIKKYCAKRTELDISVQKFQHCSDLLASIETHGRYDIYFLDIIMPELDGIKLGMEIRKKDNDSAIILLTSSSEYGVDSYSISAKDYILKPCTEEGLFFSLDKAVDAMSIEKTRRYLMNVPGGVYAIPYGRLLYIEYYKHRLIAHTVDGESIESIVLRKPFTNLISSLIEEGRFVQVSASYIINMQYVRRFTSRFFELSDGSVLPLSRTYADARSTYLDYIFEKGN